MMVGKLAPDNLFRLKSLLIAGFLILVAPSAKLTSHSTVLYSKASYSIVPTSSFGLYRSGDLVFRQGKGFASEAVLATREASQYSHVGMIVLKDQQVMVLHAAPAETDDEYSGVKLEPLALFAQNDRARHVAVMRPFQQEVVGQQAMKNALKYLGRPFDDEFDLQDDASIYCTELIALAYLPLDIDFYQQLRSAQIPFLEGLFLAPQDIFEKSTLTKVKSY